MNEHGLLIQAIERRTDDRGYCRVRLDELVADTGFSPRTVRRLLNEYEESGRIRRRSFSGPSGGLLLRLESLPESLPNPCQIPAKNGRDRDVVTQGTGPEGALSPLLRDAIPAKTQSPLRPPAHRQARLEETPESGAELLYTGSDDSGYWREINATLWEAPNGDTVSIRSMSPGLRRRLGVDK